MRSARRMGRCRRAPVGMPSNSSNSPCLRWRSSSASRRCSGLRMRLNVSIKKPLLHLNCCKMLSSLNYLTEKAQIFLSSLQVRFVKNHLPLPAIRSCQFDCAAHGAGRAEKGLNLALSGVGEIAADGVCGLETAHAPASQKSHSVDRGGSP